MAMGQHRRIVQVVGYQNSGKTTFVEKIIRAAVEKGLKVGAIKHHGHGGKPTSISGKDSTKHAAAGAQIAAVEGEGAVQIEWNPDVFELEKIVEVYDFLKMDWIVIEGYKQATYDKVVLLKERQDAALLELSNVILAVYWPEFPEEIIREHRSIRLEDADDAINRLVEKEGGSHAKI